MKFTKPIEAKLYRDCGIPAMLFFEVLESNKLGRLQKTKGLPPATEVYQAAWDAILDEYQELKKDGKFALILDTKARILDTFKVIHSVKSALYFMAKNPLDREQKVKISQALAVVGVRFNVDKPLAEEIERCCRVDLAGIESRLELEKDNLKNLTKAEKANFEDNCVAFESYGFKVDDTVSLRRYLAYEKACREKSRKTPVTK